MKPALNLLKCVAFFLCLLSPALASRNFAGSSDLIVATGSALNITSGPLTVAFWFYATSTPGATNEYLVSNWVYNSSSQFVICFNCNISGGGSQLQWKVGTGGALSGVYGNCNSGSSAGVWYHVVLHIDTVDGTAGLTQNGVNCAGQSYRESRGSSSSVDIGGITCSGCGAGGANYTNLFTGRIAEVGIWNAYLQNPEQQVLDAGIPPNRVHASALVGYWPLWGVGSPEPDLSGNKYSGTLTNTSAAAHCPCSQQPN